MSNAFSFEAEGLILHRYPFNHSILVKFLTEKAGLLPAVVKQFGRSGSKQSIIQPFSWVSGEVSGRGEVKTLKNIEVAGSLAPASYKSLCAALYINELVLMFVKSGEVYPTLLPSLRASIGALSEGDLEPSLRSFEFYLMNLVGYGVSLTQDDQGQSIELSQLYHCLPGALPKRLEANAQCMGGVVILGEVLVQIEQQHWENPVCLRQAKSLLRQWIDYHAQGKKLRSRELFQSIPRPQKVI